MTSLTEQISNNVQNTAISCTPLTVKFLSTVVSFTYHTFKMRRILFNKNFI